MKNLVNFSRNAPPWSVSAAGWSPGSDDGRPERSAMRYKNYKKAIKKLTSKDEMERLLNFAENDFENLTSSQYEKIKFLINRKIYL